MMKKVFLFLCAATTWLSCGQSPKNTPTSGHVKVLADETLYPIVDALEKSFEHSYPNASVEVIYLPEAAAFNAFYHDSAAVIICARTLDEKEEAHFKRKKLNPRTALLANDAIALVFSPLNPDTALTCEQAIAVFKGEVTDWNQINASNKSGPIHIVFDNQGSSTVSFMMKQADIGKLPDPVFAQKTTEATVEYVANNPNALGVIGYGWLSDYDDPQCRLFRKKCQVASISPCVEKAPPGFFRPFATNVLEGLYPFSRQVFAINKETSNGTGTGFTAFMGGEVGQRIIAKSGILPAYKVEHQIELKSAPFKLSQ